MAAAGDPMQAQQWGLARVGAPAAWATSVGRGIVVAIVDTGIDLGHQDLPASRLVVLPGSNLVTPGQPPQDDHGHGTHVAGIVGAETGNGVGVAGVAPEARLMPVKVLDSSGRARGTTVEDGIRFAADHGARVINISIGAALVQPITGPGFESAIEYAWSKGAVPVVAAGNSYNGGVLGSGYSPNTHAIVVTATDKNDALATYASGSNGARWGMAAPGGADPNFNPPQDEILSTYWVAGKTNQYAYDAGTSMAAPHVAGAIADLLALGLTPQQAVDRVLATAKKGLSASLGAGRLDVAAAVAGLGGSGTHFSTSGAPVPGGRPKPSSGAGGSVSSSAAAAASSTALPGQPSVATANGGGGAASGSNTPDKNARSSATTRPRHTPRWPIVLLAVALLVTAAGLAARRATAHRLRE